MINYKLGKTYPRHDSRTFHLRNYLNLHELPVAPHAVDWAAGRKHWNMMLNNSIGDCTAAAAGHMEMVWTQDAGTLFVPQDEQILRAYEAISGYVPGDDSTDTGANCLDVLKYWRKHGIADHKITAYMVVGPRHDLYVKAGLWLFGGLYAGVGLPLTAQTQVGTCWTVSPDYRTNPDAAPYSWGGHAIPIVAYTSRALLCITWGQLQWMTWNFLRIYCDELFAIYTEDWLKPDGLAPSGFNRHQLISDLPQL